LVTHGKDISQHGGAEGRGLLRISAEFAAIELLLDYHYQSKAAPAFTKTIFLEPLRINWHLIGISPRRTLPCGKAQKSQNAVLRPMP
jgi:hypothetical protein